MPLGQLRLSHVHGVPVLNTPTERQYDSLRGLGVTLEPGDLSFPQTSPDAQYASSLETIAPNITGLVDETRTSNESWFETLARLIPSIVATDQQRKLLNLQVERARAGLPPLDTAQYGLGVKVGLSEDSKQLLIYGAAGLALLVLLGILHIGRR